MTRNRQGSQPRRERPHYFHVSVGVSVAAITLFLYSFLRFTSNGPALVSISVFNFMFVFLIFPLKGPILRKVFLLLLGNVVGLAWYFIQSSFGVVSAYYLGADAFKVIYVVIGPIIDLMWIVSVWSLGLSVLVSAQRRKEGSN